MQNIENERAMVAESINGVVQNYSKEMALLLHGPKKRNFKKHKPPQKRRCTRTDKHNIVFLKYGSFEEFGAGLMTHKAIALRLGIKETTIDGVLMRHKVTGFSFVQVQK